MEPFFFFLSWIPNGIKFRSCAFGWKCTVAPSPPIFRPWPGSTCHRAKSVHAQQFLFRDGQKGCATLTRACTWVKSASSPWNGAVLICCKLEGKLTWSSRQLTEWGEKKNYLTCKVLGHYELQYRDSFCVASGLDFTPLYGDIPDEWTPFSQMLSTTKNAEISTSVAFFLPQLTSVSNT